MRTRMHFAVWLGVLLAPLWGWAGSFTPSELAAELNTNPTSIGCYAPNISGGHDAELAACINAVQSGGAYVVSRGVVSRNTFLGTWADVIDGIHLLTDPTINAKWTWRVEKLLIPKETIDYTDPVTAAFFTQMVSDGLTGASGPLTSGDVTARTTRQGSRAEVLWGPGTVVTVRDISCALRGACS
jgi:hypothetical protein